MKNLLLLFIVAILFSFNGLSATGTVPGNWVCIVKSNDQAIVDKAVDFAFLLASLRPGAQVQSKFTVDGAGVIEYDISKDGASLFNGALKGADLHFELGHDLLATTLITGKKGVLDPPVEVTPYTGFTLNLHGNDAIFYQIGIQAPVDLQLNGYAEISCSGDVIGAPPPL